MPAPVTNASDDYSGVECCCCARKPCKDVSLKQLAEHTAWSRHVFGVREKHLFIEQPGTEDCAHCGMGLASGEHMERRGEFDTPKLPDTSDWQPYDVVVGSNTSVFQVQPTRYDGLVFVPLGPIGVPQANPPKGAQLVVRDGEAVR